MDYCRTIVTALALVRSQKSEVGGVCWVGLAGMKKGKDMGF